MIDGHNDGDQQLNTLNHTLNNPDHSAISCIFRQCYITISNLKYSSSNNIIQINIFNGGHGTFKNVVFEQHNNGQTIIFKLYGDSITTFIDCTFKISSILFNISNGANVFFQSCLFQNIKLSPSNNLYNLINIKSDSYVQISLNTTFKNISGLDINDDDEYVSIINIQDSTVNISSTSFELNKNMNSIICNINDNTLYGSTIIINDCIFKKNVDINNIFDSFNSNGLSSITNTKIFINNTCFYHDNCFKIINSNFYIDEVTLTQASNDESTPQTTAPTMAPTVSPISPTR